MNFSLDEIPHRIPSDNTFSEEDTLQALSSGRITKSKKYVLIRTDRFVMPVRVIRQNGDDFCFLNGFKVLGYLKRMPGKGWVWWGSNLEQTGPDEDELSTQFALYLTLFLSGCYEE